MTFLKCGMNSKMKTKTLFILAALAVLTASMVACKGFFVDPTLTSIAVTPASPSLVVTGSPMTQQMVATGTFDDNKTRDVSKKVTWTVSPAGFATVSLTGLVTAVAPSGSTQVTVTATSGSIAGSTNVTVSNSPLLNISVPEGNQTLSIASTPTFQFSAVGNYQDGTQSTITNSVTWASDNTTVATVIATGANAGKVTALVKGSAHITATSGSVVSPQITITVTD